MTGVAGGCFDPPSSWYDIDREVFCRTSAAWINNDIDEKHDTHPNYDPIAKDQGGLNHSNASQLEKVLKFKNLNEVYFDVYCLAVASAYVF